ncbi:MAG: CAP domain-containing protein [Leisingera sp.]
MNAERTSRGLNPVQLELRLNDSAEDHSEWMLQQDVFSHTGAGGSSAGDRMADAGFVFSGSWTWAENIAWQSERGAPGLADDVINLHNSLMNSPGHRANILSASVEVIGIGIEQGNFNGWDAVMVTQNFARTSAPVQLDTGGSGGGSGGGTGATSGDDILTLTSAGSLDGLGGNDTLTGSSGQDDLSGSDGRDKISGKAGADDLNGGNGNDTLRGNGGADDLNGGSGNDNLFGGNGKDTLDGGSGNDKLSGKGGADLFIFSSGDDTVTDFDPLKSGERIDLGAATGISSFSDLMSNHASQTSQGLLITDSDGDSLLLSGITAQELNSGDFLF